MCANGLICTRAVARMKNSPEIWILVYMYLLLTQQINLAVQVVRTRHARHPDRDKILVGT
jgi:hypothetical protein